MRKSTVKRKTKETDISLTLDLDGSGDYEVNTGIGFFDHMLTAFAVHSGFDLKLFCAGDLKVDCHHTVEDVGIALGIAFSEAIATKEGIMRYGNFTIPMDESLTCCNLDISGRGYLVFSGEFKGDKMGDMDTQMVEEFLRAFAVNSRITLHMNILYGSNDHHMCEGAFKALAHALKIAVSVKADGKILSSKGALL